MRLLARNKHVILHYFRDPNGNFGDDLNPWIWDRLLPGRFDDDARELFVGIGTLINHRLPAEPIKHVFGSGVGYGQLPALDQRLRFHALRGYGSAKALGVSADKVITDPAVLLNTLFKPPARSGPGCVGVVFTGQSLREYDWEQVCLRAGLRFISCHWSVDRVLAEMALCDKVLTEAMHGAIAADAIRIPWVPITCNTDILGFKWQDWLSTLNLPYSPLHVQPLHNESRNFDRSTRLKMATKRWAADLGIRSKHWTAAPPRLSTDQEVDLATQQLVDAARRPGMLSEQARVDQHVHRYLELLRQFA